MATDSDENIGTHTNYSHCEVWIPKKPQSVADALSMVQVAMRPYKEGNAEPERCFWTYYQVQNSQNKFFSAHDLKYDPTIDPDNPEPCKVCEGKGELISGDRLPCPACGATGSRNELISGIAFPTVCKDCGGEGDYDKMSACHTCDGSGQRLNRLAWDMMKDLYPMVCPVNLIPNELKCDTLVLDGQGAVFHQKLPHVLTNTKKGKRMASTMFDGKVADKLVEANVLDGYLVTICYVR